MGRWKREGRENRKISEGIRERRPSLLSHLVSFFLSLSFSVPRPNQAFDVTPHSLITGIITERGLVPRTGADGPFHVAEWVAKFPREE